ncbi:MAG: hypothetical protein WC346_11315 [Methanogenium sp.]|jgi:hypothetical protein
MSDDNQTPEDIINNKINEINNEKVFTTRFMNICSYMRLKNRLQLHMMNGHTYQFDYGDNQEDLDKFEEMYISTTNPFHVFKLSGKPDGFKTTM